MSRLGRLVTVVSLLVGLAGGLARAAGRPNVVVLVADDMGFADVGFQGAQDIPTPHLDALARAGVRCSNGYVSGPYCSPTRAGLLTGRYQQRFGHEFNPGGEAGIGKLGLPTTETTLVERLRRAGYRTGLVGKWHLGSAPEFHPQRRGFDEFFGFLGGAHAYFAGETRNIYRGTEVVTEPTYLTDAFAREAVAFVDRHQGAAVLPGGRLQRRPHPDGRDRRPPGEASRRSPTGPGGRMPRCSRPWTTPSARSGRKLRAAGLEENTLVFFFSDNGGPTMLGTTINGSSNAPLRGSKRTTLDGGVHVPFVASWPGKLPAGRTYEPR